jgi:hypothetical protein
VNKKGHRKGGAKANKEGIIPSHVLPSSNLRELVLMQGRDWKLDIFGVQFCNMSFHVNMLLLTMPIWA